MVCTPDLMGWEMCRVCTTYIDRWYEYRNMGERQQELQSDESGDPLDEILFLARAESRVRIMEHLSVAESATQRELRTQLDISRTTVARSLRSLEDNSWVENDGDTYRLTQAGSIIAEEFSQLLDTVQRVEKLSDFLRWFPDDESTPDFLEVNDAEITSPSDGDPYAPARKQTQIFHTADSVRVLLPSVDLDGAKTITERVLQHGLEAETIVAPDLEATLESKEFAPLLKRMVETGRSPIFVSPTEIPFYLGLADDGRVQIGVEDDEGFPRSLLETTDEGVRVWAEDLYQDYRQKAERKSIEDFE
jgi:predicted transcriptional regulator